MGLLTDQVEAVLREGLTPLLRREGYKKARNTWRKQQTDTVQITTAQPSEDAEGKITLTLGVYFPAVDELGRGPPAETKPLPSHCVVQQRIGFLMPAPADHWWRIGPDTDAKQLGSELADAWIKYGKPWLEAHTDPKNAQEFLAEKGDLYWASVFALYRSKPKEAKQLLKKAFEGGEASNPRYAAHLRAWGKTHGLL